MTGFEVTSADLHSAQTFVSELAADVSAELTSVSAEVESLLATGWTGAAANGFSAGWTEWRQGAREIVEALGRMGALLATTARAYDSRDTRSQAQISAAGEGL